jgi:hypothetical protein
MLRTLLLFVLSLFTISCGPHYADYFPYHDDGTPKPQVALLPVIDSSNIKVPCNLSEEMTKSIRYEIMNTGELFLLADQDVQAGLVKIGNADWFESDQAFVQQYCDSDFVAIVELINHEKSPCVKEGMSKLKLSARIKIVDLRCRNPRIIAQEIINNEYLVCLAQPVCPEAEPFHITSVGRAHRSFAIEIAIRMENLIISAY